VAEVVRVRCSEIGAASATATATAAATAAGVVHIQGIVRLITTGTWDG
jgi:hypothetical protein